MKIFSFIVFVIIGLASCSKGDDTTTPPNNNNSIDPVGIWKLESSVTTQNGNTSTINTTSYPCIAKNILTINSDGTANGSYTGNDTCFIVKYSDTQFEALGMKGDSRSGTWTKSGNSITITNPPSSTSVGQLSMVNSKYQLIFTSTIASINRTVINTFTK
jgi:hypothetical protein